MKKIKLTRVVPEKKQPNPMKAMMHWVSRSAEKIRFPTIAAIFPMVARMLILVALQQKDQFLSIIFISRDDVSPFLASTDTDDKRRIEDRTR